MTSRNGGSVLIYSAWQGLKKKNKIPWSDCSHLTDLCPHSCYIYFTLYGACMKIASAKDVTKVAHELFYSFYWWLLVTWHCVTSDGTQISPWEKGTLYLALDKSGIQIHIFLFLCGNICCGSNSLEVPHWGASNEYPQHMFYRRNKKNISTFCLKMYHILEL